MKANRWLCLFLAICLVFTLAACGGGGGGSDDDNDADTWPVEFYRSTGSSSVSAMRAAPKTGSYKYIYFYENGTYKSGDLNNGTLTQTGSGTYTGGDPHGSVTLSLTGTYEGSTISGKTVVISSSSLTIDGQTFARSDSNTTPDGGGGSGDPVNPSSDSNDYLCFTANENDCSIKTTVTGALTATPSLEYSTDKKNWKPFKINDTIVDLTNTGNKIYIRATSYNASFSEYTNKYISFVINGSVSASGNIMSLLNKNCSGDSVPDFSFLKLFVNNKTLTTAPALPATDLKRYCYAYMFFGCTSLTTAPALPAKNLADHCYNNMFFNCTSLTTAPALPAKNLADYCYHNMFSECSSLTTAPALPATDLAECCYDNMFSYCTSLTTAPELPATDLKRYCYIQMFKGCSNLSSITVYFTKWVDVAWSNATDHWVEEVSSGGHFYCPEPGAPGGLNVSTKDESHVPPGWTVHDVDDP